MKRSQKHEKKKKKKTRLTNKKASKKEEEDKKTYFIGQERPWLASARFDIVFQVMGNLREDFLGVFVQVADNDTSCQPPVVGMFGCEVSSCFCGKLVQLTGGDAFIDTNAHLM